MCSGYACGEVLLFECRENFGVVLLMAAASLVDSSFPAESCNLRQERPDFLHNSHPLTLKHFISIDITYTAVITAAILYRTSWSYVLLRFEPVSRHGWSYTIPQHCSNQHCSGSSGTTSTKLHGTCSVSRSCKFAKSLFYGGVHQPESARPTL